MLTESIRKFQSPIYSSVSRNAEAYKTITRFRTKYLDQLREDYHQIDETVEHNVGVLRREIRNDMEVFLRRYHKYCIEERLIEPGNTKGAHYVEVGAEETDFEHMIPIRIIRDMYLFNEIDVAHALNAPTVLLSKEKHIRLKDAGWNSDTPDLWLPFTRYSSIFSGEYETYDGTRIDPASWTLKNHYDYFAHLFKGQK